MSTGANAVFTEVLEMEVDTSQFQADMDTLVTMYTQALSQMNTASAGTGMSTGMAQLATQLQALGMQAQQSLGMVASSSNVAAGELLDVASAAMQVTGALTGVAATSAVAGTAASEAGYKAGISWENFGRQLERTMMRLPAMLIVATAMAAVFETVKAPIDAIVEGFKNLEESPLGAHMRDEIEQLDQMKLRFETIAAYPVFVFLGQQLDALKKWLIDNREYVDQLMLAFGQFATGFLKLIAEIATSDAAKGALKGIAELAVSIAYGFESAVSAVNTLFKMIEAGRDMMSQGVDKDKAAYNSGPTGLLKYLFTKPEGNTVYDSAGTQLKTLSDEFDKEQHGLTDQAFNLDAAIEGTGKKQPIPNVPGKSYDTTKDVNAQFDEEVAKTKAEAIAKQDELNRAIHRGDIDHQDAAPKIHAILDQEAKDVQALIVKYEALNAAAVRGSGKGTAFDQDALIKQNNARFERVGISLSNSPGNYVDKGKTTADDAAEDEIRENEKQKAAEDLATQRANNKEADTLLKDRYKNGLVTVQDYYAQKKVIDKQAFDEEMQALIQERDRYKSLSDPRRNAVQDKIASLSTAYSNTTSMTDPAAQADAQKKVGEEIEKANDALLKQSEAQAEVTAKLLESNNHRKAGLALEEQILKAKAAQAQVDLLFADKRMDDGRKPGTAPYTQGQVEQQSAQTALLQIFMAQIQAARASASTGLFPSISGAQAGLQEAQSISTTAQSNLSSAQLKNIGSPGSVGPAQLQELAQAADAAAQALKRTADAASGVNQFMDALKDATQVVGLMKDAVNEYVAGQKKNGWVGGVANVMSDSKISGAGGMLQKGANSLDDLGTSIGGSAGNVMNSMGSAMSAAMPVIGPAIGMMFSTITSLFQSGIQKMVDAINAQIKNINNAASSGSIGLGQQITELQQAEVSAQQQLGGSKKKGAQQQLQAILQSLNAEIAQLQFEQQQIIQNFNNMASAGGLDTLTGTFATWYNTWNSINQQVKQYVDAGGSIATANEYLNQQLAIQQQALQNQLNQGDQTALNDAVQLNQLLTQRVELMKTEAQTEFGIVNADSVERQTSQAVAAGNQLATQRYNFQQQLLQMNENITLDQQRLSIEGQIFNVSGNIQQLWTKLNADNIASLTQQVAQYKDMQTILQTTQGLTFSGPISTQPTANLPIPGEPGVAGMGNITVNVNTTGAGINSGNAGEIGNAIAIGIRSGQTSLTIGT